MKVNPLCAVRAPRLFLALGLFAGVLGALAAACQLVDPTKKGPAFSPRPEVFPTAVRHTPRHAPVDVVHYAIDLALEPTARSIAGTCEVTFVPRDNDITQLELDFAGLQVQGVRDSDGRDLRFTHAGETLAIDLMRVVPVGETAVVTVAYGGQPRKGLWFAGDDGGVPTHAFTHGQCEDSRWWFPCWDEPGEFATTEVRMTMPVSWRGVAGGVLVEREETDRKATEHWRMDRPHAPYLTSLAAGEFAVVEADWEGVPLFYLAEPRYARWMEASFRETPDVLGFLSELTNVRYPYPKYSQTCVDNFVFAGMENITATTLTSLTLDDERGNRDEDSLELVAHEAAHQWFGNLLTCADWSHAWLNESWATYAALLYVERTRGADEFRVRMRDAQDEYLRAALQYRRPIVSSVYKDPIDLFDANVYPGGASRLHLLRSIVGDDLFVEGLRTYVAENAGQPVETQDLRTAFEKVSGQDLGWFFEQWIYRPGFPEFETSWKWDQEDGVLSLTVAQVQTEEAGVPRVFRTPVDIEIRDRGGRSSHRVWIEERRQVFQFPVKHDPIWVRFDKYGWIPKIHRAHRSPSEWIAMAKEDEDVNGRRDALAMLGTLAAETNDQDLREVFRGEIADRLAKEKSPAVRSAAARAAGRAGGLEARARLVEVAGGDPEAGVREEALVALRAFCPDAELARFALEQFDARFSWDTMGAAAGLYAAAAPEEAYGFLTRELLEESPHDQLRVHLLTTLATLENPAVADQMRVWASDESAHPLARAVAVAELARRSPGRTSVSDFLVGLLHVEDVRLRSAVLHALSAYDNPRARRALSDYYRTTVHPSEKRIVEAALSTGF